MAESAGKVALLFGASGLIGASLLELLLDSPEYARTLAVSRRPLPLEHARLANRIVNFDTLEEQLKGLRCDHAYCCLGTTRRQAGSEEAFRKIDHDLVLRCARVALAAGAERFIYVSSVGANATAKNYYLRVKGETESALEALKFRSIDIMQPSLLLGGRREWRPLETLGQLCMPLINPLLHGRWAALRAIEVGTVAAAMRGAARSGRRGVYRYTYRGMRALAR
jgi:uncharacterized protein YbjT (DUF2867 family)